MRARIRRSRSRMKRFEEFLLLLVGRRQQQAPQQMRRRRPSSGRSTVGSSATVSTVGSNALHKDARW